METTLAITDVEKSKLREATVVEALDQLRKQKNVSFRKLSEMTGVSHSTWNDIFRTRKARVWHVYAIAEALGVTSAEFRYLADSLYDEQVSDLDSGDE